MLKQRNLVFKQRNIFLLVYVKSVYSNTSDLLKILLFLALLELEILFLN